MPISNHQPLDPYCKEVEDQESELYLAILREHSKGPNPDGIMAYYLEDVETRKMPADYIVDEIKGRAKASLKDGAEYPSLHIVKEVMNIVAETYGKCLKIYLENPEDLETLRKQIARLTAILIKHFDYFVHNLYRRRSDKPDDSSQISQERLQRFENFGADLNVGPISRLIDHRRISRNSNFNGIGLGKHAVGHDFRLKLGDSDIEMVPGTGYGVGLSEILYYLNGVENVAFHHLGKRNYNDGFAEDETLLFTLNPDGTIDQTRFLKYLLEQ